MNSYRYISEPNVEATTVYSNGRQHILYFTLRDIKQGEELVLDYGAEYEHHFEGEQTHLC